MGAQIQTEAGPKLDLSGFSTASGNPESFSASRAVAELLGLPSLDSLPSEQSQVFQKKLGDGAWVELQSLAREHDPELFYAGLLQLGQRLQSQDKMPWAAQFYTVVSAAKEFPELSRRAQSQIEALEGRGEVGARTEFLLSRFAKDATDPAMILPMLAGTSVAGLVRGAGLSRLAASPSAWYSRGLGARLGAGTLAYAAEVPTFVASGRALRGMSGQPQAGLSQDFATGALTLGALKIFGLAGKQGLAQLHGVNEFGALTRGAALARYSHPLIGQSSLFGGLLTAHWMETKLGLRPQVDGATAVTDTLASMLSLGAGARLGQGLLGRGYAAKMHELEWRTQSLTRAVELPSLELPKLSAKATSAATGLGVLLQSPLAHASEGGRWNSTTMTATILSSLALSGLIGWGIYRARRAYVAPRGPLERLEKLREDIPTMIPSRLSKEVSQAQELLRSSLPGERKGDREAVESTSAFLEDALPKLKPEQQAMVFSAWIDVILTGKEDFSGPTLAILKRTLPSFKSTKRRALLAQIHLGMLQRRPDKAMTAFFLLNAMAPALSPAEKQQSYERAVRAIEFQRDKIDNNAKLLIRQRVLLRDLRDFLDKDHQEKHRELRDELYELEKDPQGGWVPGMRETRIAALRNEIENPREQPANELLDKFRKESEDPLAPHFDLRDALVQAHKLVELFEEEGGYRTPNFDSEFPLRAHLNDTGLREYLRNGHSYINNVSSDAIQAMLTISLTSLRSGKSPTE